MVLVGVGIWIENPGNVEPVNLKWQKHLGVNIEICKRTDCENSRNERGYWRG